MITRHGDAAQASPIRWIKGAVIAAAAACLFLPLSPAFIERWYSTGLYPLIQRTLTPITNLVPFAVFDLITVGAVVLALLVIVRAIRQARRIKRWSPVLTAIGNLATAAATLYLVFLFCWGFNYRRVPMSSRLIIDRVAPREDAVAALGLQAIERINALYDAAHAQADTPPWTDQRLRAAFDTVQGYLTDAPRAVPGRLKQTIYGPYFRWTSVDGMVDPFALEVMANPDLLPIERPFVAAHEWAHLAGYADESEANFVGWLTCLRGSEAAQYSGWMYLYWQLANEVSGPTRARLAAALAPGPRADIEAIVERLERGQLPTLRRSSWAVYDKYLKANRVEAGVRSYGLVVTLILRAKFDEGWVPVRRAQ
jgi:Protein of unknown function (DUF3810)